MREAKSILKKQRRILPQKQLRRLSKSRWMHRTKKHWYSRKPAKSQHLTERTTRSQRLFFYTASVCNPLLVSSTLVIAQVLSESMSCAPTNRTFTANMICRRSEVHPTKSWLCLVPSPSASNRWVMHLSTIWYREQTFRSSIIRNDFYWKSYKVHPSDQKKYCPKTLRAGTYFDGTRGQECRRKGRVALPSRRWRTSDTVRSAHLVWPQENDSCPKSRAKSNLWKASFSLR